MTTVGFFSILEIVGFVIGVAGFLRCGKALFDAIHDVRKRRSEGKNGRVLLIATKNRRIAWVMLAVFVRDLVLYGFAIVQPPTLVQINPMPQTWISYLSDIGRALLLLWFIEQNYRDYRKALRLAKEFKE